MKGQRVLLIVLGAMLLAGPARAGILFGGKKKPKPDPVQRVPELIGLVRTSPDESKRAEAAEELRKYETQQFPEMIPTLLDVLQSDAKTSVRLSAMSTLIKYRPVSQEIGQAIEQALAKDTSMRVRLQARKSLMEYHWAGYHSPKKEEKPTKEPPLATPLPSPQIPPPQPLPAPITTVPPAPITTQPAPQPSDGPKRMPVGPALNSSSSVKPTTLPRLTPIPTPVKSDGPDLGSPF